MPLVPQHPGARHGDRRNHRYVAEVGDEGKDPKADWARVGGHPVQGRHLEPHDGRVLEHFLEHGTEEPERECRDGEAHGYV